MGRQHYPFTKGLLVTFNYNIGYFRRDQTFMYFQIERDLREKKYGNFDILTIKLSLRLGIITKSC